MIRFTPQLATLLDEVIRKRRGDLIPSLSKVQSGTLTEDERQAFLQAITDEFCASGCGSGDEPNERGLLLESLLDCLNPVGKARGG